MVQRTFNMINMFNMSAALTLFFTSRRGINIFNISALSSAFGKNNYPQKTSQTAEILQFSTPPKRAVAVHLLFSGVQTGGKRVC